MPRPTSSFVGPALLGLVAAVSPATAQGPSPAVATLSYAPSGAASPVAGRESATSATLVAQGPSGILAIRSMTWESDGAGPCRWTVAGGDALQAWGTCAGSRPLRSVEVEEGHLVGLRICTRTPAGPVTGVRAVWAGRPDRGSTGRREIAREAAEPNCGRWGAEVRCAPGTAAPRLRLHADGGAGDPVVVGIQLLCHAMDLQCWEVGPGPDDVVTAVPPARCGGAPAGSARRE